MRKLEQIINAQPVTDGDGVKIHRIAGQRVQAVIDPYLMIDEINSDEAADYIGGFPQHPHRGFESITYMKAGLMHHRDHMGNEGTISAGDVQWMTAGAGVLHSEMPEQEQGLLHGFQIWLNLPAVDKMKPAAYRDIRSAEIPTLQLPDDGSVRVIAGAVSVNGKLLAGVLPDFSTQPVMADVQLRHNHSVELQFNPANPVYVYVYQGETDQLHSRQMGIYSEGDCLQLTAGKSGAKMLVLSGRPLKEPIAQHGPFVMNTEAQLAQAIDDYRNNRLV